MFQNEFKVPPLFFLNFSRGKIKEEKQQEVDSRLFHLMDISRPPHNDNSFGQGQQQKPRGKQRKGQDLQQQEEGDSRWDGMPAGMPACGHALLSANTTEC